MKREKSKLVHSVVLSSEILRSILAVPDCTFPPARWFFISNESNPKTEFEQLPLVNLAGVAPSIREGDEEGNKDAVSLLPSSRFPNPLSFPHFFRFLYKSFPLCHHHYLSIQL